jgi:hypothetical protein
MTGAKRLEPRIADEPRLSLLCPESGVSTQASGTGPADKHNSTPGALPNQSRRKQRVRRLPSYGSADELPAVPRALWWQWYAWTNSQTPVHPCEWRYAQHLTHHADQSGRIADIAATIVGYAHWHLVSTRTGWTDHGRVEARGRLREKLAPTTGRKAQYQLCVDPAELDLEAMPVAMAHAFAQLFGLPVRDEHQDNAEAAPQQPAPQPVDEDQERTEEYELGLGPVPGSLADQHRYLSDCEVARLGGASQHCRYSAVSSGRLHTRHLPKRLFSPTLRKKPPRTLRPRSQGKISSEERACAEQVMRRCWPSWLKQRSREQYGPPLSRAEWTELVPLVVYALRYADNPGDVVDELTDRIGSARHLPTLLAYRCRRLIRRGWHYPAPTTPPPPEPEVIKARQRAAHAAQAGPDTVQRAAALLDNLRAELATKRPHSETRPTPAPLVTEWVSEPDQAHAAPISRPSQDLQHLRYARALQRVRRERATTHHRR